MKGGLLIASAAAVLIGCRIERATPTRAANALPGERSGPAVEAVRAELERYYADFSDRDWTRFGDHFWPQATIAAIWRAPGDSAPKLDVQTVPSFIAEAPNGPGSKPIFEERIVDAEVRVHRNLAEAWVRYRARFGDSTAVATWEGIDAIVLLEHQGRWRIMSLAFTDLDSDITNRQD